MSGSKGRPSDLPIDVPRSAETGRTFLRFMGSALAPTPILVSALAREAVQRQPCAMGTTKRSQAVYRKARAELTPARIVAAATRVIDSHGLDALNMRELGRVLNASTMSVYRHFKDKDALLNAVVDDVVAGFMPAFGSRTWQDEARAMSLSVRRSMLAHPELADLIGREFRRSPVSLKVNTAIISRLSASGMPPELLAHAYWALSCYTTGHALLEAQALKRRAQRSKPSLTAGQRSRKLASMLDAVEGIDGKAVPRAAKVLSRQLDERQFLFGLECLLDGIAGRVQAYRHS